MEITVETFIKELSGIANRNHKGALIKKIKVSPELHTQLIEYFRRNGDTGTLIPKIFYGLAIEEDANVAQYSIVWDTQLLDRMYFPHKRKGEKNVNAVLTDDAVREIRKLREGGETLCKIANLYGISSGHVSQIAKRRIWKHIK